MATAPEGFAEAVQAYRAGQKVWFNGRCMGDHTLEQRMHLLRAADAGRMVTCEPIAAIARLRDVSVNVGATGWAFFREVSEAEAAAMVAGGVHVVEGV